MPKVISRSVVSSSEQSKTAPTSRAVLRSYYCLCGDFVLVMQGKLDRLPRRKTDGSYIIRSKDTPKVPARKFKLNAQTGDKFLLKRDKMELRQTFCCGRCTTVVAYQSTPPPAGSGPFLYILKGALTELQGQIPEEAFEGEEEVFGEDDLANELFEPAMENLPDQDNTDQTATGGQTGAEVTDLPGPESDKDTEKEPAVESAGAS